MLRQCLDTIIIGPVKNGDIAMNYAHKDGLFLFLIVSAAVAALPITAMAGSLDPHIGSGMPTTTDIYNRLATGAVSAPPPALFQGPVNGPTVGTGRTLAEIQSKLPMPDTRNGAITDEVLPGKTFWGLRTDGTWGLKSGTMALQTLNPNSTLVPAGYYAAANLASIDADLVSGNIKSGVSIFGVIGSFTQSAGTAPVFNVLAGAEYSNATAAGLVGTMPAIYGFSVFPGTASVPIPTGYHYGWYGYRIISGDSNLKATNIPAGTSLFGVAGNINVVEPGALASRVPKTGYTESWCYRRPCVYPPCSGVPLYGYYNDIFCSGGGQDGHFRFGIDPPVIPTSGIYGAYNTPSWTGTRFTDYGDGSVIDNLTGLVWLKNIFCSDAAGTGINGFDWYDALTWVSQIGSGFCGLSDGSNPGDWRIPNINELHSLGPTWPPGGPFVIQIDSNYYWSSTGTTINSQAYYVNMNDGYVDSGDKLVAGGHYVWPVRGGH